jgi:hypothetical protein
VLHYARKTNEPLCDAALVQGSVLFLFQATIGQTHTFALKAEGLLQSRC